MLLSTWSHLEGNWVQEDRKSKGKLVADAAKLLGLKSVVFTGLTGRERQWCISGPSASGPCHLPYLPLDGRTSLASSTRKGGSNLIQGLPPGAGFLGDQASGDSHRIVMTKRPHLVAAEVGTKAAPDPTMRDAEG
ncbi:hypothetical protein CB1_001118008 [Camelus ferus]|nr:hypothetical protein CB1_001118008 [Camelus ferus]